MKQRFYSAGLIEDAMPKVLLFDGRPVRFRIDAGHWGYPRGKYRGRVTAVGKSIWDEGRTFVRVVITKGPSYVGRPIYLIPAKLVLLPTKRKGKNV